MGATVWKVGRTAEERLMYRRSVKTATSRNREAKESDLLLLGPVMGIAARWYKVL